MDRKGQKNNDKVKELAIDTLIVYERYSDINSTSTTQYTVPKIHPYY
jgi:hypothetical protein